MKPISESVSMTRRGMITIPASIRDYLGIKDKSLFAVIAIDEQNVILKKIQNSKKLLVISTKFTNKLKKFQQK